MNRIVRIVPPARSFPSERLADAARDALVREMADHIVAAVVEGLSTANTMDVFKCLYDSPDRYHHRLVNDNVDDALVLAKTILGEMYQARYERQQAAVAAEMSEI